MILLLLRGKGEGGGWQLKYSSDVGLVLSRVSGNASADRGDARFRIPDIADKLSIALISDHARNAARYALLQLVERVHASGISLAFRNGSVFLSDMRMSASILLFRHFIRII